MNVDIAERLAKRRREAGYSQESLAERLGVSRQAVSKWERSESSPDTDNLIALAQLYGVSLDELLYVDESFKDDVVFEAADRAAERKAADNGGQAIPTQERGPNAAPSEKSDDFRAEETSDASGPEPGEKKKVNIGPGGIHVKDGEDYVHISWRDGVHVKDSKDGDEVHVGWDGVHVKEGKKRKGDWFGAGDDEGNTFFWSDDTVIVDDEVIVDGDFCDKGEKGRVVVNGHSYHSFGDAYEAWHPNSKKMRMWAKFPFPLVVIIAYIFMGVFADLWGLGLFVFFTIPLYYMVGHAISTRKIAPFLEALYPIACTAWFLYVAFVLGQPHPAWVIFLTIPLAEWLIHSVAKSSRRRKKEAEVIEAEVSDSVSGNSKVVNAQTTESDSVPAAAVDNEQS